MKFFCKNMDAFDSCEDRLSNGVCKSKYMCVNSMCITDKEQIKAIKLISEQNSYLAQRQKMIMEQNSKILDMLRKLSEKGER